MTEANHLDIPAGFRVASTKAGIKPSGGLDLTAFVSDRPCSAAGTFTTNRVCAAPVKWDRDRVPTDRARALVVNAGNANSATGALGDANVARTAAFAAQRIGCRPDEVFIASTGIIGHQLPMEKLEAGVEVVLKGLSADEAAFHESSRAIMTTDTKPKIFSRREDLGDGPVSMLGIAKGAAMIGPRMATMLSFLFTDANVAPNDLRAILSEAVERSFNCVSVEGHTSTNDTVLCLANAASGRPLSGDALGKFAAIVEEACMDLARKIPEDGEGATHLITIDVEGCRDRDQARVIARAVADSALVKTAIHGADPNWGRIVSAAGYAGVAFDEAEVSLWLNGTPLYRHGTPLDFDAAAVSARLRAEREVHIRLTFQQGDASIRFWTCDLTAEYIHLNADYTT
jgi:glutamate N-acetyltransferase / amino-acid N-acetyltransferase